MPSPTTQVRRGRRWPRWQGNAGPSGAVAPYRPIIRQPWRLLRSAGRVWMPNLIAAPAGRPPAGIGQTDPDCAMLIGILLAIPSHFYADPDRARPIPL